jgi:hypothetical protein
MGDLVQGLLKGFLLMAILTLIAWGMSRARPAEAGPAGGRIRPNRVLIAALSLGALGIAGLALTAAARWNGGTPALLAGGGFLALGALVATSLTSAYDVTWTAESLTGPATHGVWPFGPRRDTVRFADITGAGQTWSGSLYVSDGAGRRVMWNYTYGGYTALMAAIERARPDMFGSGAEPGG